MRQENTLQNTGEWFNERTGKLTASRMASAMAFLRAKAGEQPKESSERKKLKVEILAERLTGNIVPKYVNEAMKFGIDTEPLAKQAFESKTGLLIQDVGFVSHPVIDNLGCSPDGFVSDGSLIEVKCPQTVTHLNYLMANEVPDDYKPQMLLQCLVTNKTEVWFVSFDPRVPVKHQLFIKKYVPTQEELDAVEAAAIKFLDEVDAMFESLTTEE
jgi:putative phage-type endonuclease